jgi:hypothetical protein
MGPEECRRRRRRGELNVEVINENVIPLLIELAEDN